MARKMGDFEPNDSVCCGLEFVKSVLQIYVCMSGLVLIAVVTNLSLFYFLL